MPLACCTSSESTVAKWPRNWIEKWKGSYEVFDSTMESALTPLLLPNTSVEWVLEKAYQLPSSMGRPWTHGVWVAPLVVLSGSLLPPPRSPLFLGLFITSCVLSPGTDSPSVIIFVCVSVPIAVIRIWVVFNVCFGDYRHHLTEFPTFLAYFSSDPHLPSWERSSRESVFLSSLLGSSQLPIAE